ncbi:MAG: 1,4-alpha-glucan branching protein GlgB [Isosphaeraceae bacterium]
MSLLTGFDLHLLAEGTHARAYNKLGAHLSDDPDAPGAVFAVWAPHARSVSVIGDFNGWDPYADPMERLDGPGVWERRVPNAGPGQLYKFAIGSGPDGHRIDKADPFAFACELRPRTASQLVRLDGYEWGDGDWMKVRKGPHAPGAPISIYEVHLGSWMRVPEEENRWLTYREVAPKLADYAAGMGYTHVELMPIAEHPFDGSWGYQGVGYFAPTSRFGPPHDFMFLVDHLHRRGLGVILDWVPGHFADDPHGLARFDGTPLYEHPDPRRGVHREWNSLIFNFGAPGVANFLVSNALFWLDLYHVDGLRVDAVASMLYLDYARKSDEWLPNQYGGRENLEAIALLRRVNEVVHEAYPDVITFAEESTAWPMVSRPTKVGGLGFDYKWDLGWMHDTLNYLAHDPIERKNHHNELTFRMLYAFSESYVLPLSHDEVVYGKKSLFNKMPGDAAQKLANVRLLFGYMFAQPGKKLLFMGDDLAQPAEWDHDGSIDWGLLDEPGHAGVKRWVRDLNTTYRAERALHELDTHPDGFQWVDCNDSSQSVLCLLRQARSADDPVLVVCNFTPVVRTNYRVGVPHEGRWDEILNSDATLYGGEGHGNIGGLLAAPVPCHGFGQSLNLVLPPLALVAFRRGR